jgi:hypothetical protein
VVVGAVVPTVNIGVCDAVPLICTEELDKVHVGAGIATGVIAQLRLTVPENDSVGVSDKVNVALCPALIVWEVADGPVSAKSGGAWITSDSVAWCTRDPDIPWTTTGYVPAAAPTVVEITSEDEVDPLETDAGVKAQLAPLGKPEHASITAGLNPKSRMRLTVALAEFPAMTGEGDNAVAEMAKSAGVVFNSTATVLNPLCDRKTMSGRPSLFMSAISTGLGM